MKHFVFVESTYVGLNAIATAKRLGHYVTFLSSPIYQINREGPESQTLLNLADQIVECQNPQEPNELWSAVKKIHSQRPIDGMTTVSEYCVESVAYSCKKLNLFFIEPKQAALVRNKYNLNEFLHTKGLPSNRSSQWQPGQDLNIATQAVGYPCVIKPTRGTASLGTFVIRHKDDQVIVEKNIADFLSSKRYQMTADFLGINFVVEPYHQGQLYSVEVAILDNHARILCINQRRRSKKNEAIELGTIMPAPLTSHEAEQINSYINEIVNALKLKTGLFHIEIIVNNGQAHLIDFNPRLMGGGLARMFNKVYQTDIFELLVNAHMGLQWTNQDFKPHGFAVSSIFGCETKTQLKPSFNLNWIQDYQSFQLDLRINVPPNSIAPKLESNHDYLGHLFLIAQSQELVQSQLDKIHNQLEQSLGVKLLD